jgi:hypothetical protein
VVPYTKIKDFLRAGWREDAESKVHALGDDSDECVTMDKWLYMCELVIGFAR